ncbi:MAG: glycosyl transferase 2 family protein [Flavobacterium sp.]|nr:glycosyl transferase 2 family protein [Flavobacterium sp.]
MNEAEKIHKPFVSIAIITFNQKDFLKECLESVLSQDYPNFEIVVGDDCSNDGTQEVLKDYDKNYPGKFKLILNENNLGITKNSNRVHFACSGKYIAWLGGDDLMLPGKISKQVRFMEHNHNCTICYHNLDVFDSNSNQTICYLNSKFHPQGTAEVAIRYGVFNGASSTMVRSYHTPARGFNPLLPVASDWLFWVETLLNGGTICYLDEVLGRYRRHENNVTANNGDGLSQGNIDTLNSCNIILSLSPKHFSEVMWRYSDLLFHLRFKLPYVSTVWKSFILAPSLEKSWKTVIRILVFALSFGRKRL